MRAGKPETNRHGPVSVTMPLKSLVACGGRDQRVADAVARDGAELHRVAHVDRANAHSPSRFIDRTASCAIFVRSWIPA
jgi:hypothetical protein